MKEFFSAALPWILMGVAIAVFAANCAREKENSRKTEKNGMAVGMCIGILAGIVLTLLGVFKDMTLGISIGMLWEWCLG